MPHCPLVKFHNGDYTYNYKTALFALEELSIILLEIHQKMEFAKLL